MLIPTSSLQPFVPGAIENLTMILNGINLGNILGPFSLNMAMISFVRDLEVSLVSPTAHVPQHWTPLGLVVTGAMGSVV